MVEPVNVGETLFRHAVYLIIARVCHENNRAICEFNGDLSQKPWDEAEPWQRESCRKGVKFALANPDLTPKDQHDAWCKDKLADGWKYGPVKDPAIKEHPCLVRFEELPEAQRIKDVIFRATVLAMAKSYPDFLGPIPKPDDLITDPA